MKIGNGKDTDFWRDPWCGPLTLKDKFRELYEACDEQTRSVALMAVRGWRLSFRRWLEERAQTQLRQLQDMLSTCALSAEKDRPKWIRGKSGIFFAKSTYSHMCSSETESPHAYIWKSKIPLKIKIFMRLLQQNAILSKDNLLKRSWQGDKRCCFCLLDETIEHLFFG